MSILGKKSHLDIKDKAKCIQLTKPHTSLSVEGAIASWYSLYPTSHNETDAMF